MSFPNYKTEIENNADSIRAKTATAEEEEAEAEEIESDQSGTLSEPEIERPEYNADVVMQSIPAGDHYPKEQGEAGGPRGLFYALRFRNFRLFFYGQLISVAGTWMQDVAQKWLVWEVTRSPTWLGIVSGANAVPFVLFAVWGGQIADRYSRRAILIWTQSVAMLLAFVLAYLAWPGSPIRLQAWHIAVVSGLSGIVNAFNMPAQQAFVTDMVEDRKALGNAIALNSLRFNLARVLGPILAGVVLVKVGSSACFALNGLSFIAVIISLQMMILPALAPKEQSGSVFDGFRYIRDTPSILRIILLIGASSILTWPLSTLFPVFADAFKVGERGFSAMMAANGLGAAIAGLALAWVGTRVSTKSKVYGGSLLFCMALLLLSLAHLYYAALACLVLSGFAMIVFGISSQIKVQEEVPDDLRGRVMAVYSLVFNGLFSLGGLEIGYVATHLKASGAVRLNATLCLLATLALLAWSVLDKRKRN